MRSYVKVSQCIQASIREVDNLARWGGEEFVVVSPNTAKENALHAAERIRTSVSSHRFSGIDDMRITVSIGLAGMPDPDMDTAEKLLHAAEPRPL